MRFLAAIIAFALLPAGLAGAAWRPPVPGEVVRAFDLGADPFEAGRHRGVDLAAAPGSLVRAPCAGPVAFAGQAGTSGRVVTLRCGAWHVTDLPLASIAVREGATVGRGEPLGTVAPSRDHPGLHLGARRAGTRFGYADPLRFLAADRPAPPPLGRAPRPARPRPTSPRPAPRRIVAPRAAPPRPVVVPALAESNRGPEPPFAPWPAWLGLALVLAGAGLRLRGRPRAARGRVQAAGTLVR
jgi:hypothetical protein